MANTKKTRIRIGRLHTRSVPSRVTGWALCALGLAAVIVNWIEEFTDGLAVLPGGHSPLYLIGGIAGAVLGLWFAGALDPRH